MATTYNYRRGAAPNYRDQYVVPRLELDVIATPRHERYYNDITARQHHDVRDRRHDKNTNRLRYDDNTHRRARTDHEQFRRPRPAERSYVTARAVTDGGFDAALHYRRRKPEDYDDVYRYYVYKNDNDFDTARVSMYTHDSHDPYSCMCFPRASSKTIPSMMYDSVRCPHPEHVYQPAKQDFFTYPWSVQTFRPPNNHLPPLPYGYMEGQRKPPSAVTAPPFVTYTNKEREHHRLPRNNPGGEKPLPHTAPVEASYTPLLSAEPSDRRLRRTQRHKAASLQMLPPLEEEISPNDSVSQVIPPRRFRSDSLRLHTVDGANAGGLQAGILEEYNPATRALSTPRYRPPPPGAPDFPQTPTRMFKGEYVDPNNGQSYRYDIKYGRTILGGTKRLKTV